MKSAFFSLFFAIIAAMSLPALAQMTAGEERATTFVAGEDGTDESLDKTLKNAFFAAAAAFSLVIFVAFYAARRSSDRSHRDLERIAEHLRAKGADDV